MKRMGELFIVALLIAAMFGIIAVMANEAVEARKGLEEYIIYKMGGGSGS